MSNYVNINLSEMTAFLVPQGFQIITVPGTKETVFSKRIQHVLPLSLRVYTGIVGESSRGCGEDAIRVTLFWRNRQGEIKKAGGSKRVHRVTNWRKNLAERLNNWNQDFTMCICGSPMVEREGKNKQKFMGCCNFPLCRNTKQILSENFGQREANRNISLTASELRAESEALEIESRQW